LVQLLLGWSLEPGVKKSLGQLKAAAEAAA